MWSAPLRFLHRCRLVANDGPRATKDPNPRKSEPPLRIDNGSAKLHRAQRKRGQPGDGGGGGGEGCRPRRKEDEVKPSSLRGAYSAMRSARKKNLSTTGDGGEKKAHCAPRKKPEEGIRLRDSLLSETRD